MYLEHRFVSGLITLLVGGCGGGSATTKPDAASDAMNIPIDAAIVTASFTAKRVWVGWTGSPEAPLNVATPTFYAGQDLLPVVAGSAGAWTAETTFDALPTVLYHLPEENNPTFPIDHVVESHAVETVIASTILGDARAITPPTSPFNGSLAFSLTLDSPIAAGDWLEMQTIGLWTSPYITTPALNATTYSETVSGPSGYPLTIGDGLFVMHYAGSTNRLIGLYGGGLAQTGGVDPVSGTMDPVVAGETLDVTFDAASLMTTLGASAPGGWSGGGASWKVRLAPGASVGASDGIRVASGSVSTGFTGAYGTGPFNPAALPPVLTIAGAFSRTGTLNSWSANGLSTGFEINLLAPTTAISIPDPAIPTAIEVNGTILTTEGQLVPAINPSQPATVTITASNATASTIYRLSLRWFTASSLGGTQLMFDAVSTTPTFTLPPGVFEEAGGRGYILRASCETGVADAAHGDLRPRLPNATVYVDSPVFSQ